MDTTIPAGTNTWYVIARNDCGTTRGPNWRFIVQSCLAPAALSGPVPANLAPLAAAPTLFNWADAARATSYDVYLNGTLVAYDLYESQWYVDTTIPAGSNTWYVIARNDCGETRGLNWRFIVQSCLAPAAPAGPVPANLATLAATPTLLNWADAARATSYDVYLDGTLVASGLTASQWACGTPISAGSHTWRVVAQNACGTTTGPLWNFTITCSRPAVPAGPTVPVNNAILSNAPTRLNWADTARATSYDVYLDGVLAVSGLTNSQWSCNIEIGAGVHRWYVVARNACGSTTGPVWTFTCAPPATPATPSPASGVVLSQSPTLLNWADTLRATSYDVYVDGVLAASGLTTSQYTVSERLSRATHTWYVVARNSCGTTRGPLWSFIIARTVTN